MSYDARWRVYFLSRFERERKIAAHGGRDTDVHVMLRLIHKKLIKALDIFLQPFQCYRSAVPNLSMLTYPRI